MGSLAFVDPAEWNLWDRYLWLMNQMRQLGTLSEQEHWEHLKSWGIDAYPLYPDWSLIEMDGSYVVLR